MSQSDRPAAETLRAIVARNQARKALKARTTPGPWQHARARDGRGFDVYALGPDGSRDLGRVENAHDAAFLAHARNDDVEGDIEALVAQLRRCEALIAHLRDARRDERLRAAWEA